MMFKSIWEVEWGIIDDTCVSGGTGRRARFRILCRKAWGFKSPLAHFSQKIGNREVSAIWSLAGIRHRVVNYSVVLHVHECPICSELWT